MNSLALLQNYSGDSSEDSDQESADFDDSKHVQSSHFLSPPDPINFEVKRVLNSLLSKVEHQINFQTIRLSSNPNEIDLFSDQDELVFSGCSDIEHYTDEEDEDWDETTSVGSTKKRTKARPPTTRGELTVEDLPPVERLNINMNVQDLQQIGRVSSIVNTLVIVQSFRNLPALNLDSVLFFKDGSAVGTIFDVFGPVIEPSYAIRFNCVQEIVSLNIIINTPIYFVPRCRAPITEYVFVSELRKLKGSDASWLDNNEPPEHVREYSDDEEERMDKIKAKAKRKHQEQRRSPNDGVGGDGNFQLNHQENRFGRNHGGRKRNHQHSMF